MFKTIFFISFVFACAIAIEGVDFSKFQGAPAQATFNCFKKHKKDFLIMQIWGGGEGINGDFVKNYKKAKAAKITYIDAYAFICNGCDGNTPANICKKINETLPGDFNGTVWIDVENCEGCWKGSPKTRLKFVQAVVKKCNETGMELGVYSGLGVWESVFGKAGFDGGSLKKLPLWYSHYDDDPSFKDWPSVKFGGWEKPAIKQYKGSTPYCKTTVDFNAY